MKNETDFCGQPIRSLQTMLRAIAEHESGYVTLIPDGIYGRETMSAVSNYQRRHGMPITGITDQDTWDSIVGTYDTALTDIAEAESLNINMAKNASVSSGQSDPNVLLAQSILNVISSGYGAFPPPSVTGTMDEETCDCLRKFQEMSDLPQSGNLDKTTWKHLALQYPIAADRCKQRK